jgi:hypothetical protein
VLSWSAVACAYYGLVQLDGQMHIQAAGAAAASTDDGGGSPATAAAAACVHGRLQVKASA